MKNRIIDKMEKEIIVAMKNLDFERAVVLDSQIKEIKNNEDMIR